MLRTHTHPRSPSLISEHNFLSVRVVSMTMRRSECINASPDKQWSFNKTRGSLRQLVKSMLRVSWLIKASPLRPDTVSILAGPWQHAPMIGLQCLSVRQLSWTNDSLRCLLDRHDNLILWARQGKSDLGAFYWGWGKLTRADKSLPWAINRIKEQQQRQTLLPPSVLLVFFSLSLCSSAFPGAVILKTSRTTGPIDLWNNKEPKKALGRVLLSRWNTESGYRSELKDFQMFKAIPVWPRGKVYCLGHLSQGYENIVYMVGRRPCVYTDVLSF